MCLPTHRAWRPESLGQLLDTGCPGRPWAWKQGEPGAAPAKGVLGEAALPAGRLMSECLPPPVFPAAQMFQSFFVFFAVTVNTLFFFVNLKYFLLLTDVTIIVNMICFHFSF